MYRAGRHPRRELEIRRDLAQTRRSVAFLRAATKPRPDDPAVLVALYRDDIYEAKLGALLASALRLHGFRPVVSIPSHRATRARRYVKTFGVDAIVAQEAIALSDSAKRECATAERELLAGTLDFETIKGWTFRGWSVGNHVLSTLIRTTFDGAPDLGLEANQDRLATILADVLRNYVRAEQLIEDLAPKFVLVEEANYSTNGPLVDVAVHHGVDVIQTIGIWREDALISKRLTKANRRVDAKSVAPETLERLHREPWTAQQDAELDQDFAARYGRSWRLSRQFQPNTQPRSAEQIVEEVGLDPARPTAVIYAHVLWDASLFFGVDLFENYSDWLVQTVGAAIDNGNLNWIVKAHPSNVFRALQGDVASGSSELVLIRERFPELPAHVHVLLPETDISTLSLYQFADYGITVRGTPGMEMACFGKPVFTAGTGTYAGLGFTLDSSSSSEYLARLATIETVPPISTDMRARARRYAHTLFTRRPWTARSFELRFGFRGSGWHPLNRDVVLNVDTVTALARADDLTSWARWVSETHDVDYLH